jgi:hypothetical protein
VEPGSAAGGESVSYRNPWPIGLLGIVASAALLGCVTSPSIEPYYGEPFFHSNKRLDEYAVLACIDQPEDCIPQAPYILAWIREANRIIEANNALLDDM